MKIIVSAALGLFLLSTTAIGQNWFKVPRVYDNFAGELRLGGDADGDGDIDLLRFDGGPSQGIWTSFTVMLSSGNGELTAGATVPLPSDSGGLVLYEDVNGDGIRDVVASKITTSPLGPGIIVRPGLSGGVFGPEVNVALSGNILSMRVGRANADLIDDIAVVHFDPAGNGWQLRWILGSPMNAFVAVPGNTLPSNSYVEDMAVVDENADGVDDFAVSFSGAVHFYYTVAGAPITPGPTFAIPSSFGLSLLAADLDSDGDKDLLAHTAVFPSFFVQLIRNQGGGTWALNASQTFPNTDIGPVFAGDWDADSDLDLFLHEYDWAGAGYGLYRNTGSGSFVQEYTRDTQLTSVMGGAGLFDLDGDGHLDFADARAIFFGDGTFKDFLGTPGASWHRIRDWEGDGDIDIPLEGGQIRKNDGRGVFTTTALSMPTVPPPHFYGGDIVLEDFDGDGKNEMLAGYFVLVGSPPLFSYLFIEMRRFVDNGNGTVSDVGSAATTQMFVGNSPALADDVDGDGDVDLLNSQGLWLNDGSEFFGSPANVFQSYWPVAKGDVDGDGDQDFLATFLGGTASMALLRRTGPAAFTVEILYPTTTSFVLSNLPVLADLDDDGDLDFAVDKDPFGTVVTIFQNVGGSFSQAQTITIFGELGQTTIAAGDVDGDGLTDLAVGYPNRLRVYRRTGPGFTYEPERSFRTNGIRTFSDIDNDGDKDVVGGNTTFNTRFDGPSAGFTRQYGQGKPGSGGLVPVLGMQGPVREGKTPRMTLRECVGGAPAIVVRGPSEGNIPNFGFPGLTLYVDPIQVFVEFGLPGTPGQTGGGSMDVVLPALPVGLGGVHVFLQVGIADAGATFGIATTNGLEVLIGSWGRVYPNLPET